METMTARIEDEACQGVVGCREFEDHQSHNRDIIDTGMKLYRSRSEPNSPSESMINAPDSMPIEAARNHENTPGVLDRIASRPFVDAAIIGDPWKRNAFQHDLIRSTVPHDGTPPRAIQPGREPVKIRLDSMNSTRRYHSRMSRCKIRRRNVISPSHGALAASGRENSLARRKVGAGISVSELAVRGEAASGYASARAVVHSSGSFIFGASR